MNTVRTSDMVVLVIFAVLAVIALLAIAAGIRFAYYAYARKRFYDEYGVRLPSKALPKRGKTTVAPGMFSLMFPRWMLSCRDGTHDNRTKNYQIYRPDSVLAVGQWQIQCPDPFGLYAAILALRQSGVRIALNNMERAKFEEARQRIRQTYEVDTIEQVRDTFANDSHGFEEYVGRLYERQGLRVRVTPASNDGGADVIATDPANGQTTIIECKCYAPTASVGRPVLQKLAGANQIFHADRMACVTTSRFSSGAQQYAAEVGIVLVDGNRLVQMINEAWPPSSVQEITPQDYQLTDRDLYSQVAPDLRGRV